MSHGDSQYLKTGIVVCLEERGERKIKLVKDGIT